MKAYRDKVAVITGAASGIGRALANRCAREGMKVVLADVEPAALAQAEAELRASGAEALGVLTDVSKAEDVDALAEKALARFGGVHLLCNNAGVGWGGPVWMNTHSDWEWVLGANLWGVIHGIRAFVPRMLEQATEGHIVNTASLAGLLPGMGVYGVTKHAAVALSEALYYDLAARGAPIGVSVLCPGYVKTQLVDSSLRNRPPSTVTGQAAPATEDPMWQRVRDSLAAGMPPDRVADLVFAAVEEGRFYILTHPIYNKAIRARLEAILQGGPPPDLQSLMEEGREH